MAILLILGMLCGGLIGFFIGIEKASFYHFTRDLLSYISIGMVIGLGISFLLMPTFNSFLIF